MSRAVSLLLTLALPAIVLVLTPVALSAEPPAVFEGKTARQWADQLEKSKVDDIRTRWYATYALGQMGPQAGEVVGVLHTVLDEIPNNEYVRGNAAWALGRIGAKAEPEIPFLTEKMRTTTLLSVRRNTVEALGNLGPAAKPSVGELVKMLGNEDTVTRVNAAVALWQIDHHAKAVPALIELLRSGAAPGPYQAAVALGRLGAEPDHAAAALIDALRQSDADVRRAAARSIGQLGRAAFAALKDKKALDDPDEQVRSLVVEAVGWMGAEGVNPLIKALEDKSPAVRRAAARALGRLGPEAKAAEPALVDVVSDAKEEVRDAAAKALRRIRAE